MAAVASLPAQLSPADLRSMLRADAVGLALGSLLLLVGLLTLVLWGAARRRARTLPPRSRPHGALLGIFAVLYGLRLLMRTATGRLVFDLDPEVLSYAEAAITYVIPLPLFIFVRNLIPIWRRSTYWAGVALALFAISGVLSDAILRRPNSAVTLNNLIAIAVVGALLAVIFRPGLSGHTRAAYLQDWRPVLVADRCGRQPARHGARAISRPGPGAIRLHDAGRMPRHAGDAAGHRGRATSRRDRWRAERRPADPVFNHAAGDAACGGAETGRALSADERRRGTPYDFVRSTGSGWACWWPTSPATAFPQR